MTGQRFEHTVGTWLRDEDPAPPDSHHSALTVAARLPSVRQQSRWWPLPLLRRRPAAPIVIPDTDHTPPPIPATNGQSPTVIGRTQSMLSPVKAITAGVLVFALGGVLLIAQPFDRQGGTAPGAEVSDAFEPVPFTLRFEPGMPLRDAQTNTEDGVTKVLEACFAPSILSPSDPRVAGNVTFCRSEHHYGLEGAEGPFAWSRTYRIENDEGAWQGSSSGAEWQDPAAESRVETQEVFTLEGEGAYQGLYATMAFMPDKRSIQGVIIGGPPPETPVLPVTD